MRTYVLASGIFLTVFLHVLAVKAQKSAPSYHVDTTGKLYWNRELPVYLRVSPSREDKGVILKSQGQSRYSNPYYLDNEGKNEIRTYYATDPETGKRTNPPVEVKWEIYADGEAPESQARYVGATSYASKTMKYYGGGLQVLLSASDATSGGKAITYQIDEEEERSYTNPLNFPDEGRYTLRYYGTDYVGNVETAHEQTFVVDTTPPKSRHKLKGIAFKDVIGDSSVMHLDVKDSLSGVRNVWYRINEEDERKYNGEAISVAGYKNGSYTLHYYAVDHVGNREKQREFSFYLDKIPPILAADVLGDRFIVDDQIYFSGRSKLKLTAVDNKSGVKHLKYSVDGEPFKPYKKPFYLPSKPGTHIVRYYAVDEMGNATEDIERVNQQYYEFKHNVRKIYVDLTGPALSSAIRGQKRKRRDTLFISPRTKLVLKATDGESGLKKITYSLDGEKEENEYQQPFSVKTNGHHDMEFFGYDKVNNRNIDEFSFFVDAKPPRLAHHFSVSPIGKKEGLARYPSYVQLYASATDKVVGTDRIFYTLNGGAEKLYTGKISGFVEKQVNSVELRAVDDFGNSSSKTLRFYVADKQGN